MISLLVLLVCAASAHAATLATTGYDAKFSRYCAANSVFYGVRSWHNNFREDRQWVYYCKTGYPITATSWTGYVNSWDGKMDYKCGANQVVTGMYSHHNNHKEDRLWKFRCSKLDSSVRLYSCGWSGNVNSWDGRMDYSVSSTRVINGFYSVHNNQKEDRMWKVHYCGVCSTKKVNRTWSNWSACTKPCTGSDGVSGTKTSTRTCYNGNSAIPFCSGYSCSTAERQTVKCNLHRCKVNGGFSAWSAYGACSASCGLGRKTRTRQCNNPAPAHGGANCVGPTSETASCKVRECPVNGQYSMWSPFSACSVSCGPGTRKKTRTCTNPAPAHGGKPCAGLSFEISPCKIKDCSVNGGFSAWSAYGACSASCGLGRKTRTRQCNNPAPAHGGANCVGPTSETASCKIRECPVDGKYSDWTAFSACSASCGPGTKKRTRACTNPAPAHGGKVCDGPAEETSPCKIYECPIDGKFGDWSVWSECSVSCGYGLKTRTRQCNNPAPAHGGACCEGDAKQTELCRMKKKCTKTLTCAGVNGVCRQGQCPSGEERSASPGKRCQDKNGGSGKKFYCCVKATVTNSGAS